MDVLRHRALFKNQTVAWKLQHLKVDADATDCLNVQNFILLYVSPKLVKLKNEIL